MTDFTQFPLITPLADAFAKLQKVGGTNLIFEFIGTLLLLVAFFFGHGLTGYIVLFLGCLIILIVFCLSLYFGLKEYNKIRETVTLVQSTATQMAKVASDLIELEKNYHEEIDKLVASTRRAIEIKYPALKQLEDLFPGFDNINRFSVPVKSLLQSGENLLDRFNDALTYHNTDRLQDYLRNVETYEQILKRHLEQVAASHNPSR